MKAERTKQPLALLAMFCAIATVAGCASTSLQVMNSNPRKESSSMEPTQSASLNEFAFQKLDLDTNGTVTFDEWQRFDASAESKENFRALDENGDEVINATELLKQAPKHSAFFSRLGDTNDANDTTRSRDKELSGQKGSRHFSLPLFEVDF
jgi:hypothetical protein